MDEDSDYIRLPLEDRCLHKLWKARVHGYEEATKLFRTISDEKSPEWNKYLGLIKKFVSDSNVAAQEKGLEASLAYIENAFVAGKTVGEVMPIIVNKCIGVTKAKTKDLAIQICLMYIEIEKQDIVVEELLKGTEHKNPKISVACVTAITQGLREFGSKVINVKLLLKKIPVLLEDRDKNVREESKTLTIEMFKWIGPILKSQLASLKPIQLQELEVEFEKVKDEKAIVQRYLRSQQEKQSKLADATNDDEECEDAVDNYPAVEIDPLDLIAPVDILSKLPKDFYEKLEAKKWQERKESLDYLEQLLTNTLKLENGDYGELIRNLKKVVTKDTNVVLVAIAAKCLALVGKGLKRRFQPYATQCLASLLEKFKEKKQNVVVNLREAVDAIYDSTSLEAIQEDVVAAMESKNPAVKAETVAFITRCFTKCNSLVLNKKLLKTFTTALLKTLSESDPLVRDNSAEAIGTAWKVVGEKVIAPFLTEVDNIKIAKIKEASEKAVIVAKQSKVTTKPTPSVTTTAASKLAAEKPRAGSANPKPIRKPVNKTATFVKKSSSTTSINKVAKTSRPTPERELTEDDVLEKATELFTDSIICGLSDGNWKTRLLAMEQFTEIATNFRSTEVPSQLLIKLLNKKPGFKDNNFQVLKLRLECLLTITENLEITTTGASVCLTDLVSLLGDAKNNTLATKALIKFAERLGLDFVSSEVLEFAFVQQKNPKVQQEALLWLSNAILEFGFKPEKLIEPKSVINNVKKGVSASNPNVRGAAITLLGTMYLYIGSKLRLFFENEKTALLQLIDAEFDKHKGEKPPSPKRGKIKDKANGNEEEGSEEERDPMPNIQDLVPRVDISSKITSALVEELSHRDWKVRTEAINKLQEIITEAKFITGNLGEAVPAISERLTDLNGRLAAATISLCESIAVAMGPSCKMYVREFLPGMLQGLGDNKNYLRAAAIKCMNTWGDTAGNREFFEGEMLATALKSGSPALRTELWAWIAEKLPELKNVPKDELMACLPHLYNNLEDRNSDVRKNANDAVYGFMMHLSYQTMFNACEKLKPASVHTIKSVLDKTRGSHLDIPTANNKGQKASIGPSSANSAQGGTTKSKVVVPVKPKSAPVATKKKKDDDADFTPLLKQNNLKMQRNIDENKLKVLKWNFTTPREEFVEQLREQMTTAGVNKTLITNMFHPDFKFHLKAIDSLSEDIKLNTTALINNLDLILKWLTIRFFDTNPSVILRGLEYLLVVFRVLAEEGYNMIELEAASFLPYLVLKTGDPKDTVRNLVRDILDAIGLVYSVSKLFTYVMDGVKSKNARQRTGCLEQLSRLIENYGLSVCQPTPAAALKEIAKQISDRDNAVRNAALNCVVTAYFIVGDKVRQMIGRISDKDMSLLDERIKRASKNRPTTLATGPPTAVKQSLLPMKRLSQCETSPPQINNETYNHYSDDDVQDDDNEYMEEETSPVRPVIPPTIPPLHPETPQRKKHFGLDDEVIGKIEATTVNYPKPNLYEYDKDYLNESVPATTPLARPAVSPSSYSTRTFVKNKISPSTKSNNLENWITVAGTSNNLIETIKALEQIDTYLIDEEKKKDLDGQEAFLMSHIINRLAMLRNADDPEFVRCYKPIFAFLMKVFSNVSFAQKMSETQLQQLLTELINLLVEKKLEKLENWDTFQKIVNNLVLKILERSEHTAVICALFQMLYDSVAVPSKNEHYHELIMKCIWKAIKYVPEWDTDLDYGRILTEINKFLSDFPSSWWKKQSQDTPLRTYKTMVHALVKARGNEMLTIVNFVPGLNQQSELFQYINKLLKHIESKEKTDDSLDKTRHHLPRAQQEELSQILNKIGDKTETQQGLRMLYDFKNDHPEVNINQFLSNSSKFFQKYILRGLENVKAEKEGKQSHDDEKYNLDLHCTANEERTFTGIENGSGDAAESDAQRFKQRLESLQIRAGWDQYKKSRSTPTVNAEQPTNLIPTLRINSPPQKSFAGLEEDSTSIEQIKRKLSQLKNGNV